MTNEEILRTPAGEPVVAYMVLDQYNTVGDGCSNSDDAEDSAWVMSATEDQRFRVIPCHLLPLPEGARTVKREGGAVNAMLVGLPVLRNAVRQIATTEDALAVARQNARMALAFIIREELTRTGETQTAFAKRFGVSKAHVTDCLYNRRYSPALAEALLKSHTADAAGEN